MNSEMSFAPWQSREEYAQERTQQAQQTRNDLWTVEQSSLPQTMPSQFVSMGPAPMPFFQQKHPNPKYMRRA